MKNKGIIALSIVAGLLITALIIGLSFSAPEKNIDGGSAVVSDDIAANSSLTREEEASGYYMLDDDGTYYRIESDGVTVNDRELEPAGVWKVDGSTISLFADE